MCCCPIPCAECDGESESCVTRHADNKVESWKQEQNSRSRAGKRRISASWPAAPRAALNPPLSNFTTSQLLTQHFTRPPTSSLQTQLNFTPPHTHLLFQLLPDKENTNCVLCPPRSKTSSPSVRLRPATSSPPLLTRRPRPSLSAHAI